MDARSRVTLNSLASLASGLYRLRLLFGVIAGAAGIWFAAEIVMPSADSISSLLALTVMLWAGLALAMGATLAHPPAVAVDSDPWLTKVKKRLLLAGYGLAALALLGLAVFILWLTLRAVGMAYD